MQEVYNDFRRELSNRNSEGALRHLRILKENGNLDFWWPLHDAAFQNDLTVSRAVLDMGVPVDARDGLGRTTLFACQSYEMASFLLSQGASVGAVSTCGCSVLCNILEIERYDTKRRDHVLLLMYAGAKLCECPSHQPRKNWPPVVHVERLEASRACVRSTLYFLFASRFIPCHRDVVNLIVRLVWATRYDVDTWTRVTKLLDRAKRRRKK